MGLNRISNPTQLHALSRRVGVPIIRAYSRWFENQNTVLAFSDDTTAWVVPKVGPVEPYTDEPVRLVERGVRTGSGAL